MSQSDVRRGLNGRFVLFVFNFFAICLILNALQAYSVFSIPVPWFGNVLFIGLFTIFVFNTSPRKFPGLAFFFVFLFWVFADFLFLLTFKSQTPEMPLKATVGYFPYVSLRFFNILVCGLTAYLTYWFTIEGAKSRFVELLIQLGVGVSLYSIYAYFAQIYGWPEIPRTRMGTSGEAQSVVFSYAFHRALGPFREPSFLAEWLVLPLFLSMYKKSNILNLRTGIIALALLMTGSLAGIVGLVAGALAAGIFSIRMKASSLVMPFKVIAVLFLAGSAFAFMMVTGKGHGNATLTSVLWERVQPILFKDGLKSSDRNYVYYYLDQKPFTMIGDGVGNPNIEFSKYLGSAATASFLSLYITTVYSSGYIGLALLLLFLATPAFLFLRFRHRLRHPNIYFLLAPYFGWLIMFSVHSEELSISFGICYSLLVATIMLEINEKPNPGFC